MTGPRYYYLTRGIDGKWWAWYDGSSFIQLGAYSTPWAAMLALDICERFMEAANGIHGTM